MIPKAIIEKAVEGGWEGFGWGKGGWSGCRVPGIERNHWRDITLDPAFWQALGKAHGKGLRAIEDLDNGMPFSTYEYWWQYNALRFVDLILTGRDTEKFWADILGNK